MLIRRFGPAHLWGHWDLRKQWELHAMPLTIRLLVENGGDEPWDAVSIRLACPEGWKAEGRQPKHWTRPHAWAHEAFIEVGSVPARSRSVAPFWVQWPEGLTPDLGWHEGPQLPFHATTQPGPDLTLYATDITASVEVTFEAAVTIQTAGGETIERVLAVPVSIVPR